jgi:hypothetical protein
MEFFVMKYCRTLRLGRYTQLYSDYIFITRLSQEVEALTERLIGSEENNAR